jgi:hypothetical protein
MSWSTLSRRLSLWRVFPTVIYLSLELCQRRNTAFLFQSPVLCDISCLILALSALNSKETLTMNRHRLVIAFEGIALE